jgi:hypothetical protein
MLNRIPLYFGLLISALLVCGGLGCGGGSQPKESTEATHLNKIGAICEEYKQAKKVYPTTLEELKSWAVENGKAQESDFKSTRDNEFYVIEPMGMMGSPKTKGGPVIIREATGKNGLKFVYAQTVGGRASEMGEASLGYMTGQAGSMMKEQDKKEREKKK